MAGAVSQGGPSTLVELLVQNFQRSHTFRRSSVFWTIFTMAILLWIIGLAAAFGAGVIPVLLVLGSILILMNLVFRRKSLI
jgi:hypothetical protein